MAEQKKEIPAWVLWAVAGGAIAAFFIAWKVVALLLDPVTDESVRRAEVLGAFFSALAFGGVIGAIVMQKRELELQREELDDTRKELSGQRIAMELHCGRATTGPPVKASKPKSWFGASLTNSSATTTPRSVPCCVISKAPSDGSMTR